MKSPTFLPIVSVLFAAFTLSLIDTGHAQSIFVRLNGIQGSSTRPGKVGQIEATACSFDAGAAITNLIGATSPRPGISPIRIVKALDKSSPLLFVRSLLGTNLGEAIISYAIPIRDRSADILVIKLRDAKVTNYKFTQGSETTARLGSEQFELSYSAIEVTHTEVDPRTGNTLGANTQRFTLPGSSVR